MFWFLARNKENSVVTRRKVFISYGGFHPELTIDDPNSISKQNKRWNFASKRHRATENIFAISIEFKHAVLILFPVTAKTDVFACIA